MKMNIHKNLLPLALCLFMALSATAQKQFAVLLFTKTDGWHHESIHEGVDAMRFLAARHNFDLTWEENAERVMTDDFLKDFDVVVFLNTTKDVLNDEQQEAFKRFIESGKGYVGIHAAADTEYDWPWYNQLVGRMFLIHPAQQTAMIDVEDANFPGMETWQPRFMWTDEWYQYKPEEYAKNLHVLLALDESTYKPETGKGPGMGYHPISWYHEFDGGRAFYTGLGHIPAAYQDQRFLNHLYGGIYWAATGKGIAKK